MTIITIILAIVVFLNILLGALSVAQNRKSFKNIFFSVLCFSAALWTFANFMTGVYPTSFWIKSAYSFGSIVISSGLIWTLALANKSKDIFKKAIFIYTIAFIFSVLSFSDGFIVKSYIQIYPGGAFSGEVGYGMIPYSIFYLLAGVIILYELISGYLHTKDFREKNHLKYILYGAIATLSVSSVTSFIFPILDIYQFSGMDSAGFLIFLFCFSYAVIEYKFLDIRVVATEIFISCVWIVLLVKIFFSNNAQDILVNISIFITVIIFGILVIKNAIKVTKQKEQIEDYAMKIEQAYEVEKKSKEELEILDKSKNQFLMAIQHHLRTPLTAMLGYSDLIITGGYGKQSKKTIEAVNNIQISTKNLIKMVNDFLDVTQFQLGKEMVTLRPDVDVLEIIKEIVNELKFESDKKNIYLKLEEPDSIPLIKADREKLKAAIYNIIDNAVKYTTKGGVDIKIIKNRSLIMAIKDNGIGIAKNNIENLLGKTFERGEAAKKTFINGRGIGLYITNQIIKAHNGKIWAESDGEGKGSIFYIELPKS